ncbi:MAG: hypothetical protein Q8O25_06965 [Sulfurisoma sp.]|nr:hypothetical protein [Sulfurisoma sp.]
MSRLPTATAAALALITSLPAAALDGSANSARLTCNVSGLYADGTRIAGSGTEEISIEIRRVNLNEKEPAKPAVWGASSDIRVTSNGRTREAALLRSATEQVVFAYASDALVDGAGQTLALTYEIHLDRLRLKRTVMALFSPQAGTLQSADGNCVRAGAAAVTTVPTAPVTSPAPDWLVELRRKLKECGTKDPVSAAACVERMKARYCTNRPLRVPECE